MDEVISRLSPKYQEENDEMLDATGLSGCRFEFTERVPKKVLDQCITYFQVCPLLLSGIKRSNRIDVRYKN